MTSTMNNQVYGYKIYTTSDIPDLEPYMSNYVCVPDLNIEIPIMNIDKPIAPQVISSNFFPKQRDSLFWCLFIASHGIKEFYTVDRFKNREIEEKDHICNSLRLLSKNETSLTKTSIQEMMGELMSAKTTSLSVINAFCIYYHASFVLVSENTYLEFSVDRVGTKTEAEIFIIYKTDRGYSLDIDVTPEKIKDIKDTKVRLEKFDKPLKGISTYKIIDLESMLEKLNVEKLNLGILKDAKVKKQDLYQVIWRGCDIWSNASHITREN